MKKRLASSIILSAILLVGCGKTVEDQVDEGMAKAEAAFKEANRSNTTEGNVSLYLPKGFVIDPAEEESNYFVTSDDDQYILFINEQEPNDSKLNYDLILKDKKDDIVKIEELKNEDSFGFAAVIKHSEKHYELVVSIGGVKLSTMTNNKKMDEKLAVMMDIVRSVEITK